MLVGGGAVACTASGVGYGFASYEPVLVDGIA